MLCLPAMPLAQPGSVRTPEKKIPKSTVAKAKTAGFLKTRLIEQRDDITISNSLRVRYQTIFYGYTTRNNYLGVRWLTQITPKLPII